MSVFDAKQKTLLRVKDPIADDKTTPARLLDRALPPPGSLSWGSINSESALSSTTGVDCMKVTGDRWKQMDGSLTENYTRDKKIDVKGKHQETIKGDRQIMVTAGNMTRTVASGKITDQVAQDHEAKVGMNYTLQVGVNVEETVGVNYKLSAVKVDTMASGLMTHEAGGVLTIQGSLVKVNC